jgi:DNA-binding protein H-NS
MGFFCAVVVFIARESSRILRRKFHGNGNKEGWKKGQTGVALSKHRNPKTGDSWTGRGKQARWLTEELGAGKKA